MSPIDPSSRIRKVTLAVGDLDASVDFYERILGLPVIEREPDRAMLGADGERSALELSALEGRARRPGQHGPVPRRLAAPLARRAGRDRAPRPAGGWPLEGAADHGVSEALYLSRPRRPGDRDLRRPAAGELAAAHRGEWESRWSRCHWTWRASWRASPTSRASGSGREPRRARAPEGRRRRLRRALLHLAGLRAAGEAALCGIPLGRRIPPSHRGELLAERRRRGRSRERPGLRAVEFGLGSFSAVQALAQSPGAATATTKLEGTGAAISLETPTGSSSASRRPEPPPQEVSSSSGACAGELLELLRGELQGGRRRAAH